MVVTVQKTRVHIQLDSSLGDRKYEFIGMAIELGARFRRISRIISFARYDYKEAAEKLNARFGCNLPIGYTRSASS